MKYQSYIDNFFHNMKWKLDYSMNPRKLANVIAEYYRNNSLRLSGKLAGLPRADEFIENQKDLVDPSIMAGMALTFNAWNENKQIYTFSKTFLKDLLAMGDCPIYIQNLPFEGFYLDLHEYYPTYPGALVFFKEYRTPFLALVIFTKKEVAYFECQLNEVVNISELKFRGDKGIEKCIHSIFLILNYLSSSTPDIIPEKHPSHKEKRPVLPQKDEQKWAVGTRYVREYKRNPEPSEPQGKIRHSPRAHIRKAHWQVYWTGPGRKVPVTKWVAPVFVNTGKIGTVVRKIN